MVGAVQQDDVRFCEEMLPRVSRTFALSIEALPDALREPVRVAYLLCRIVDTIEDAAHLRLELRELLFDAFDALMTDDALGPAGFETMFGGLRVADADAELCSGAGAVFRRFRAQISPKREAIRGPVLVMSRGMREYTRREAAEGRLRILSTEDLERYCYYVAGTVGELLTDLFLLSYPLDPDLSQQVNDRKIRFGLALQMVNIVKDVADDAERGVCFLPEDALARHGITASEVLHPAARDQAMAVVREVTAVARGHLQAAAEYTELWPADRAPGVRLFTAVPLALALGSLAVVEQAAQDVLSEGRNPKVSREFVRRIMSRAPHAVLSNAALRELLAEAATGG